MLRRVHRLERPGDVAARCLYAHPLQLRLPVPQDIDREPTQEEMGTDPSVRREVDRVRVAGRLPLAEEPLHHPSARVDRDDVLRGNPVRCEDVRRYRAEAVVSPLVLRLVPVDGTHLVLRHLPFVRALPDADEAVRGVRVRSYPLLRLLRRSPQLLLEDSLLPSCRPRRVDHDEPLRDAYLLPVLPAVHGIERLLPEVAVLRTVRDRIHSLAPEVPSRIRQGPLLPQGIQLLHGLRDDVTASADRVVYLDVHRRYAGIRAVYVARDARLRELPLGGHRGLAFPCVPRVHVPQDGESVLVDEEAPLHDGVRPVLLRDAVLPQPVLPLDLEIEVRRVVADHRGLPPFPREGREGTHDSPGERVDLVEGTVDVVDTVSCLVERVAGYLPVGGQLAPRIEDPLAHEVGCDPCRVEPGFRPDPSEDSRKPEPLDLREQDDVPAAVRVRPSLLQGAVHDGLALLGGRVYAVELLLQMCERVGVLRKQFRELPERLDTDGAGLLSLPLLHGKVDVGLPLDGVLQQEHVSGLLSDISI